MKNKKLFAIMFAVLITLLFLPIVQGCFNIFHFEPLQGAYVKTSKPALTFDNYANGKYQANLEKYVAENHGFRQPIIRLYNQYLWDFYKKTYAANDVVYGKDGWLFFNKNIEVYYGTYQHKHFKSNDAAKSAYDIRIRTMNKLRHVLKDFDIEFLAYISPDKCYVFPEFVPEREHDTTTIDACAYFVDSFKKLDFPCIEMTEMFCRFRDTMRFEPFTPAGAHWNFSCVYAADSLFRFIESMKGINLADINISNYRRYDKAMEKQNSGDFDMEWMLNLSREFNHSKYNLYGADVTIHSDSTCTKPSVLFIGNSFFWRFKDFINFDEVFDYPRLWYYNKTARNLSDWSKKDCNQVDFLSEIFKSDYIVTFCGDTQLFEMSFGFAGKALVALCIPDDIYEEKIKYLCEKYNYSRDKAIDIIVNNPEVFQELKGDGIPTIRNERALEKARAIRQSRIEQIKN